MAPRRASFTRKTNETEVQVELIMDPQGQIAVDTGIPFFDHLLEAMAFHGHFGLTVKGRGDLEVDEHHLVEDTGIVLGETLSKLVDQHGPVRRFALAMIPMDEALSEVIIDVCGRPYLLFDASFPQQRVGSFEVVLLREFLNALVNHGRLTLHATLRRGNNSHHMAESLFKALGVALSQAYEAAGEAGPAGPSRRGMSTKGRIG